VSHRQIKVKGRKRPKSWHHGQNEDRLWEAADLPEVDSGADVTAGEPVPLRKGPARAWRRRQRRSS
jgi:hypothetical protein